MDCVYEAECANFGQCRRCFNHDMYKPHKEYQQLRSRSENRKEVKQGMDFENRGTKAYNSAVTRARQAARRQPNSGAMSNALGDMITEEQLTASLAEFKERSSVGAKGGKQITIKKEWLDKLAWESRQMNRDFYFLPFSFAGAEKDYVAMEYDMLLRYIQNIQFLLEQNRLLKLQLNG
ncbi:hypothetical protein GZH47_33195 (plasmid) [Paenibacillus rhizovicinus]|uniref:Uncharacterized protein n=1 Tax=Paenibacillus rhizovicinus TaxID=2704463 RepID=A0A6C0PBH7_9BACL|nr:hypothetical protein [Paenibacillus rhizovicinus]QHW35751.1 hypothetical protein GZH47_33195 [Paenibacillus rhizovicinus]